MTKFEVTEKDNSRIVQNTQATTPVFKTGDRVKLKEDVEKIEVNNFENYRHPYYFDSEDVATVFGVEDSPRVQHEPGYPNTQTFVRFEKIGFKRVLAQLAAIVQTSDLELIN